MHHPHMKRSLFLLLIYRCGCDFGTNNIVNSPTTFLYSINAFSLLFFHSAPSIFSLQIVLKHTVVGLSKSILKKRFTNIFFVSQPKWLKFGLQAHFQKVFGHKISALYLLYFQSYETFSDVFSDFH